ncbi:class I SAM-dependent methyltransferase [Nocardia vinacea]|uniref:class I SAM-dependent methyltransferase n=1 Tax=Nocardia vinacea TaxID=96468 RepID=UPI0033D2738A
MTLPFRADTFDVVTGSMFVGHIPAQERASLFSSIERVLKPDGMFIMTSSPNEKLGAARDLNDAFGDAPSVQQFTHHSANAPDGFPLDYHVSVKQHRTGAGHPDDGVTDPESTD